MRNLVLRTMERQIGIQRVWPYRLLVALSFLAILHFLYSILRRIGANRTGSLAAVFVLAILFEKRGGCSLVCGLAGWSLLALRSFLGFSSVVLSAHVSGSRLFTWNRPFPCFQKEIWIAHTPFAGVLLPYIAYFFSQSRADTLAGRKTGGYDRFHGLMDMFAAPVRSLINIALPFRHLWESTYAGNVPAGASEWTDAPS